MDSVNAITGRLSVGAFDVSMRVPSGFESYLRVFFPFQRKPDGSALQRDDEPSLSWQAVANMTGAVAHGQMEVEGILYGGPRSAGISDDEVGDTLTDRQMLSLSESLAAHTSCPEDAFVGLWSGYRSVSHFIRRRPELDIDIGNRNYLIYRGGVDLWREFRADGYMKVPDLWWPNDLAWCFGSDTDLRWAFIGGTEECIGAIMKIREIESIRVGMREEMHFGMDKLNRSSRHFSR